MEIALAPFVSEGNSEFGARLHFAWQEWAEGFQTLDDLQSVDLTPEDELRIKRLLSDVTTDGKKIAY